ncbi:MAG: HNH endonuclease [Thermoplasmata archaeon]|nr:HNH endonuclease [Thermoplasmata archaeon]
MEVMPLDILHEKKNKPHGTIWMHRLIINTPKGMETDHHDHNTLNNQKYNLRIASRQQNAANQKISTNNKSGYKGVYFYNGRYMASIRHNGKSITIGRFNNSIDAAKAYDKKARELFGEYAKTNFN